MAAPKLYKASEVCELAQVQPYVLRSWEKEFPGIGVQKQPEGPRVYRPADLEQVRRIRQLVFAEGLTLAGARRRLEENGELAGVTAPAAESMVPDLPVSASPLVEDVLPHEARSRIDHVRVGLRSILDLLSRDGARGEDFALRPPAESEPPAAVRTVTRRTGRATEAAPRRPRPQRRVGRS